MPKSLDPSAQQRVSAPAELSSEIEDVRRVVATFVAVGADESVQRVITAVHRLSRRLTRWYDHQLADLQISAGEWSVLEQLARSSAGAPLTPSQLAQVANVAPSSMTHRLDRMVERGLISRTADLDNRTRVLVALTDAGYSLYAQAIRDANLVESDVLASLSDTQVHVLAELLETVIAGLDEAALEA